jgi:hypothetical protein
LSDNNLGVGINMFRILCGLLGLLTSVTIVGCAHEPPPAMVWIRLDGQRGAGNPVLAQQFETDRTICFGNEQTQTPNDVEKRCMAEKGYTQVPQDQAEAKLQEFAAINAQKQAQASPPAKTAQKKK